MPIRKYQNGLTLIEMMIAMILGLIVVATILTIFVSNVKSTSENIKMTRLNQELRTVMNFMADELKRAGHSADPEVSYFINALNTSTAGCILYAYDADLDGVSDANENFGFRLNAQQINWQSGVTNCNNISQPLTSTDTATITAFDISASTATAGSDVGFSYLDIELEGETQLNPGTATRKIEEVIRVRNDDAD